MCHSSVRLCRHARAIRKAFSTRPYRSSSTRLHLGGTSPTPPPTNGRPTSDGGIEAAGAPAPPLRRMPDRRLASAARAGGEEVGDVLVEGVLRLPAEGACLGGVGPAAYTLAGTAG